VKESKSGYDVVIVDLPDPESVQINRFYTKEFFQEVSKILKPKGVFSISLAGGENLLSPEAQSLNSVTYNTLSEAFEHLFIVPGATQYYIASRFPLDADYFEQIEKRGIAEHGVTTGRPRRKATQIDFDMLKYAALLNGPTQIALTFCDHLDKNVEGAREKEDLTQPVKNLIKKVEAATKAKVTIVETGKEFEDIVAL